MLPWIICEPPHFGVIKTLIRRVSIDLLSGRLISEVLCRMMARVKPSIKQDMDPKWGVQQDSKRHIQDLQKSQRYPKVSFQVIKVGVTQHPPPIFGSKVVCGFDGEPAAVHHGEMQCVQGLQGLHRSRLRTTQRSGGAPWALGTWCSQELMI